MGIASTYSRKWLRIAVMQSSAKIGGTDLHLAGNESVIENNSLASI
jgi:hypothetical protein